MRKHVSPAYILLALGLISFSFPKASKAQSDPPARVPVLLAATPSAWTPEDMVNFASADQFRISPDGKWVLWVKTVPDTEKDRRDTLLMLSSMVGTQEIQLTRPYDFNDVTQPRWSPDGKLIAFLSHHDLPGADPHEGKAHLWLVNPFGGEPWPALSSGLDVQRWEWRNDDTIVFSAGEEPSLDEIQKKQRKDDSIAVDDTRQVPPVRLFELSVKDKKVTRITENDGWIETFDVSPDGKSAVALESRELSYSWDHKMPPAVWVVNLDTGQTRRIFVQGHIYPQRVLRWAADNSGVYTIAPYSDISVNPAGFIRRVYFQDLKSGTVSEVPLDWDNGVGFLQQFDVTPDGFITFLADGVRFKPARYTRHGATWSHEWLQGQGDRNYMAFAVSKDARSIVYEYSTASLPPRWYRAKLAGGRVLDPTQLVDVYARFRDKTPVRTRVIHWKGANGDEVQGILFYPDNYQEGKRYPLITYTHGGPMDADLDAWVVNPAYVAPLLTQKGAFLLETNYHGSANYSLEWSKSICCGKYYDLEIPDIEKGVDNLIAKGLVDPNRIGAFGWSNGAILTLKLTVTDPERYKAAVEGAPDDEYVDDWGNSLFGQFFNSFYFGKSLFQDPEIYIQKSPVFQADRVRTPTLIFHGTVDRTDSTDQGWLWYRALYYLQKAPVRLVLFPNEPHFPTKLSDQLRVTTEEVAWFDKYLFHSPPPLNVALKSGSALSEIVEHAIRKVGGLYGVNYGKRNVPGGSSRGVLIPEIVRHGNLEVGRFEVTRAQYAAFDPGYKFPLSTENYPANGISFDQAKAYCAWLSELTGRDYRLPTPQEAAKLYLAGSGGNTLDYWAGYKVNPDDARKLEAIVDALPPDDLLKPVGSFPGTGGGGEAAVYDLDGNVAEWATSADGKGRLWGGSADRPADPMSRKSATKSPFAGFRIVLGVSKTE